MNSPISHSQITPEFANELRRLFGDFTHPPRASIVIPINAQKDLSRVLLIAPDIVAYKGDRPIEFILVINNYPPKEPPREIDEFLNLGFRVLAVPKVIHDTEVAKIAMAARILGIEIARSESVLLFDADCRVPNAGPLLDWYINQLESNVDLAYTHVDYYDLPAGMATTVRMFIHHVSRWFKRAVLGIPTCRGSNYAVKRQLILDLYSQGRIPHEIQIGFVLKSIGGRIAYSGAGELVVLTSGRFFTGGWMELARYLTWRIGFYRCIFASQPKKNQLGK